MHRIPAPAAAAQPAPGWTDLPQEIRRRLELEGIRSLAQWRALRRHARNDRAARCQRAGAAVSAYNEEVSAALARLGFGSELARRRRHEALRAKRRHICLGCGLSGGELSRRRFCQRCDAKLTAEERAMFDAHNAYSRAVRSQKARSEGEQQRQRAIRAGDQVAVFNQSEVVDGARGTVLGTNSSGWLAVRLATSGADLIVNAADVRRRR